MNVDFFDFHILYLIILTIVTFIIINCSITVLNNNKKRSQNERIFSLI